MSESPLETEAAAPAVSILIPCRNEVSTIEACLRSISVQEPLPQGGAFEILLADGLSDDGTREVVRRLSAADPRIRLIDNPGRIVSTGLNAAIRASRAPILIRMDAHTEYASDYIRCCVAVLEQTGADNVGGPWAAAGTGWWQRAVAAAFHSPFLAGGGRSHDLGYEGPLDTVYLGCWRRPTFDRIGLFDEELVRNQDDEMNLRLTLAGGRIWQSPRIRSVYRPRPSLRALFRQYLQYGYWKVRVIQKHRRPASIRHLVPVIFALGLSLGWLSFFVHPVLGWLYLAAMGAYLILSLIFSVRTAARAGWDLLAALPVVFLVYHLGYGFGFAAGLWDFVVLKRGAQQSMTVLSRSSPT